MSPLTIDIWSDIACPWCYVGKRRLEAALAQLDDSVEVAVRWHAFELNPSAPAELEPGVSYIERLARKYRATPRQAEHMVARMTEMAAGDGIAFRFDIIRPGNTFDAHRLVHHAGTAGIQDAVKERLLRGYLCEGEPIGNRGALARMAEEAGLDPEAIATVLETDQHADAVRNDEAAAASIGVTGVPFFLVGKRLAIPGAQPVETMRLALEKALELTQQPSPATVDGPVCGPDGC